MSTLADELPRGARLRQLAAQPGERGADRGRMVRKVIVDRNPRDRPAMLQPAARSPASMAGLW